MKVQENRIEKLLPHILIVVFAFILYGNTLVNDYALDDLIVIKENVFTKQGVAGIPGIFKYDSFTGFFGVQKNLVAGGRYRPLSIATFAIEYEVLGGFNPFLSHLINILLYAATGILIMQLFKRLLKNKGSGIWLLTVPFITSLLFLSHPVHTEVVANIKGRDEIMALFFSLSALVLSLDFIEKKKWHLLMFAGISFFLGLLSKENAMMFLLVIPATIWFFLRSPLKPIATCTVALLVPAALFIMIRYQVLGYINSPELPKELLNNPFLFATTGQKFGTILFTLGLYLKLLFLPHPLTHDYYPYHIPLISFSDYRSLIPLTLYLGLIVFMVVKYKSKSLYTYGIFFYLSTLFIVSNLLFSVGTFMNERFIFMPSVGFSLIVAGFFVTGFPKIYPNNAHVSLLQKILIIIILLLFTVKTISRNTVWKNDFTLFSTDVLISENSLKCTTSAGGKYLEKAQSDTQDQEKQQDFDKAIKYLEKAISIYPYNNNSLILYGNALVFGRQDYKKAVDQYIRVISFDPYDKNAMSNLIKVLAALNDKEESDYKIRTLLHVNALKPDAPEINSLLGKLYGQYKGKLDSAAYFLEKAVSLAPDNPAVFIDLGIVYGLQKKYDSALNAFQQALKFSPNDQQIIQNINITNNLIRQNQRIPARN